MKGTQLQRREAGLCIDCDAQACPTYLLPAVAEQKASATGKHVNLFLYDPLCVPCYEKRGNAVKEAKRKRADDRRRARERDRIRTAKCVAGGKCVECGKRPAWHGVTRCPECFSARRIRDKRLRAQRQTAGTCLRCGKERENTRLKMCVNCRRLDAEYARRGKLKRQKSGA